jgi:hypothetical protein
MLESKHRISGLRATLPWIQRSVPGYHPMEYAPGNYRVEETKERCRTGDPPRWARLDTAVR